MSRAARLGAMWSGKKGTNIYGAEWNYGNSSTVLVRLEGAVGKTFTAAIGTSGGSSGFDDVYPWKEIKPVNITTGGVVTAVLGDAGFSHSPSSGTEVMVRIPKYWYKVEKDTVTKKHRFYVADNPVDGFAVHPAFIRGSVEKDYIYIAMYHTSSGNRSTTGGAPTVSSTRASFRASAAGKGAGWSQVDYAAWSAYQLLYIIETANWNSQSVVGQGYVSGNTSAIASGGCNSMSYHSGRAAGTDGKTAIRYRYIENPWGNVNSFVDGINFNGRVPYICTDQSKFADDTATYYSLIGFTCPANGNTVELGRDANNPFAILPLKVGGSGSTYIPDFWVSDTGWRILVGGGMYGDGRSAGLLCLYANGDSSLSNSTLGSRLMYLPN